MVSRSTTWSLLAGLVAFLSSVLALWVLSPLARTFVKLLTLPTGYSTLLLASPVPVIGAVLWWTMVERPERFGYVHGGAYGALVAVLTVTFWVLAFVVVWELALVLVAGVLVGFALVVTVPVGGVGGLVLMYARRALPGRIRSGTDGAPQ